MSALLDFNCYGLLLSAKHFVKLISSLACNDAQSREIALVQLVGPQNVCDSLIDCILHFKIQMS